MEFKHRNRATLLAMALCILCAATTKSPAQDFKPLETGALAQAPAHNPVRLMLSPTPLPGSAYESSPQSFSVKQYALAMVGPKEAPEHVTIITEDWAGSNPMLRIASDISPQANKVQLDTEPYHGGDGKQYTMTTGDVTVPVKYGSSTSSVRLRFFRYDPNDPARALYKGSILYTLDSATRGDVHIGNSVYHGTLYDTTGTADYRGMPGGVMLLLDVNGNGKIDRKGEVFDTSQPFNIGGTTYELSHVDASGTSFSVVKSSKTVAEILPPPDLRPGKPVRPFTMGALDGSTIHFPADYHGKLVMLIFYASWCPDCRAEIGNLVSNYNKYHDRGVEAVAISLDKPDGLPQLQDWIKQSGITWRQIYEGKFKKSAIADLYAIYSIPTVILVDGTTGTFVAAGDDKTLGPNLARSLDAALASPAQSTARSR